MDITHLYKSLISSLGLQVDDNGLVSMVIDGDNFPCTVDDKRLVVPTQEVLRAGDWKGKIAFHPISENVLRGESPVLKKFRMLINHRLTEVIATLMTELMEIAANSDYHGKLSPKQSEFLSHVPDADVKTVKALEKILSNISTTGENRLVSIYLKRGGVWMGEKYSRVAVASFPITEEFESGEQKIFGVKLERKKDKKTIEELFKWIIPNADNPEVYSHGSNSMTAPYFHALCHSYLKIAKRLNAVTNQFKKHLDNPKGLLIDTEWESVIDDLSEYRDLIPALEGNDGALLADDKSASAPISNPVPAGKPIPVTPLNQPAPVTPAPSAPTSVQQKTKRGIDFNAAMRQRAGQQPMFQPPQPQRPVWGASVPAAQAQSAVRPGEYAGRVRGVPAFNTNFPQRGFGGYSQPQTSWPSRGFNNPYGGGV